MTSSVAVDVQIASESACIPDEMEIESWLQQVVDVLANSDDLEVSVRVVDVNEGRDLNNRFRATDKATNVLSFPVDSAGLPAGMRRSLGDIVICGPVVEREATEQGKDVGSHWAHMLVHGALHLLGYDHETEEEAEIMETLEKEILAARGVKDPYAIKH